MNNTVNETFGFGNEVNNFGFGGISGLGESNYENEDLFNTEVSNVTSQSTFDAGSLNHDENQTLNVNYNNNFNQYQNLDDYNLEENNILENQKLNQEQNETIYSEIPVSQNVNSNNEIQNFDVSKNYSLDQNTQFEESVVQETEAPTFYTDETMYQEQEMSQPVVDETLQNNFDISNQNDESVPVDTNSNFNTVQQDEFSNNVVENNIYEQNIDDSYLDISNNFGNTEFNNEYNLPIVEPTVKYANDDSDDSTSGQTNIFTDTPINELEKLTHYEEEKIQTTDIKALFDRVGINVKEASDIFKKNTEMKEKIDSRFEELKKLQSEVEKNKKSQYDEINAYKEEVLGKLTEKKEEIEKRLNKLKDFQSSLEKEKQEFEQYRKAEKEEIDRVQKEVQEAYEGRREELNHIEDVLRKQKDALDEERSQLSLDRIQYESDKNELANNLLKFNEIVDSFTNGMDKINKEQA